MTESTKAEASASTQAARAEDIFRRYPDISEAETKEALTFLKKGKHLEIGLVTGISDLKDNIAAFREEHGRALRLGLAEILVFTALFVAMLAGLVWLLAK